MIDLMVPKLVIKVHLDSTERLVPLNFCLKKKFGRFLF